MGLIVCWFVGAICLTLVITLHYDPVVFIIVMIEARFRSI